MCILTPEDTVVRGLKALTQGLNKFGVIRRLLCSNKTRGGATGGLHVVCAQLTPHSRMSQGLKSMALTGDAQLVGMSVLPAGLSAPEASGSETDDDFAEEDAAEPEEAADSPVPSLLLVTQQVGRLLERLAFHSIRMQCMKCIKQNERRGVMKMCGRGVAAAANVC